MNVKLCIEALHMRAYGIFRKAQDIRHCGNITSLKNKTEHFGLAPGKVNR